MTFARRPFPARRLVLLPLAVVVALLTSACGAGFAAGTNQVHRPTNGAAGDVGFMSVRNLLLLQDPTTDPPVTTLIGGFANNDVVPDHLTAVAVSGAGAVTPGDLEIPGRALITPGSNGQPGIDVPNATFKPGTFQTVTLTFAGAGTLTLTVLVMLPDGPSQGG
ncbi:MAG TPA: hypothetical protein VMI11_12835 [Actinomycetes bacterium]|nr:hypothetical protein [Actinomycetes bacterium]